MRRTLAGLVALAALPCLVMSLSQEASAQSMGWGGLVIGNPSPYAYTPVGPGQYGLKIAAAAGLAVPSGALYATVCAEGAAARYTVDGMTAPTAAVGMPLVVGACVKLEGPQAIANFRAISASGVLDVEFAR